MIFETRHMHFYQWENNKQVSYFKPEQLNVYKHPDTVNLNPDAPPSRTATKP